MESAIMPLMPYVRQGMFSPTHCVLLMTTSCVPSNQCWLPESASLNPTLPVVTLSRNTIFGHGFSVCRSFGKAAILRLMQMDMDNSSMCVTQKAFSSLADGTWRVLVWQHIT